MTRRFAPLALSALLAACPGGGAGGGAGGSGGGGGGGGGAASDGGGGSGGGGGSSIACSADAGTPSDGAPCSTNADCICPTLCAGGGQGDGGTVCLFPCETTADCATPTERCAGFYCVADLCGPGALADGGAANGSFGGPCDAAATGDGTCLPVSPRPGEPGACAQNGGSTTSCDANASRAQPGLRCAAGLVCDPTDGGAGLCLPYCDPTGQGPGCPSGEGCGAPYGGASLPGLCFSALDGGCLGAPDQPLEYAACGPSSGCGCPLSCAPDPASGPSPDFGTTSYCLASCGTTADCPDLATVCRGGHCVYDYCLATPSGGSAGGALDGRCDSSDAGDGSCVGAADPATGADLPYGLCLGAGSATGGCDPAATRQNPAAACAQGLVCAVDPNTGASSCAPLCDPTADGGACPAGTSCQSQFSSRSGLCLPLGSGGA